MQNVTKIYLLFQHNQDINIKILSIHWEGSGNLQSIKKIINIKCNLIPPSVQSHALKSPSILKKSLAYFSYKQILFISLLCSQGKYVEIKEIKLNSIQSVKCLRFEIQWIIYLKYFIPLSKFMHYFIHIFIEFGAILVVCLYATAPRFK